jgi:site-specific DNA recombinase
MWRLWEQLHDELQEPVSCAGMRDRAICDNRLTIRRDEVEARVLKAMEERLWNQDLFEEFCQEFTREMNRLHGQATAAAAAAANEIATLNRQIAKYVRWIAEEWTGDNNATASGVRRELAGLEQKKAELAATAAAAESAQRARPLLHPEMGTVYRHWVIEARDGLHDPERRQDAVTALRAMVDEIVLTPQGDELGILLKGDLAAMLAAARKTRRPSESDDLSLQVSLVAGAGFEPATFGL